MRKKVEEFKRVLLVRLPDLFPACLVGGMPAGATTDQPDGKLAADGVVAINLAARQGIEVEPNLIGITARHEIPPNDLKSRQSIVGRRSHRYLVLRILRQAEPKAVDHRVGIAGRLLPTLLCGHKRQRLAGLVKPVDRHPRLGISPAGQ